MIGIFGIALCLLFDTSRFYTITHAIWHVMAAFVAYRLVKDRDRGLGEEAPQTPNAPTSRTYVDRDPKTLMTGKEPGHRRRPLNSKL